MGAGTMMDIMTAVVVTTEGAAGAATPVAVAEMVAAEGAIEHRLANGD